jgi:hypothetical protein
MQSRSTSEIKEAIMNNWIQIQKSSREKLSEKLTGGSPPSIFIGSYSYPKVSVGPLVSTYDGDTKLFDHPEEWAGQSLEEIIKYRLSLIRGTNPITVDTVSKDDRFIETLQELTMANKSSNIEVNFDKKPILNFDEIKKNLVTDSDSIQYGLASKINNLRLSGALTVDKKIEKAHYDNDLKAEEAIFKLYDEGIEISKLSKVLSIGMLGIRKSRKIVPTKWSITAIDQIISSDLIKKIKNFDSVNFYQVYNYSHLGNIYSIILIPDKTWCFEMHEAWIDNAGQVEIETDMEIIGKLRKYPKIGGSFFAARVAVAEYLVQNRKSAGVIVFREIQPQYLLPVGVWQIREGIRKAMRKGPRVFDSLEKALNNACNTMSVSKKEWISNSNLLRFVKSQKKILDFFEKT